MTFEYIREKYKVPAKRGAEILFRECKHEKPIRGRIIGYKGHCLRVVFEGNPGVFHIHPTRNVEYL